MSETITKSEPLMSSNRRINGKKGLISLIVGIIILAGIIVFLVMTLFVSPAKEGNIDGVFLTNGRIYFGHIIKQNSQTVVLRDVYYLQVQQTPLVEDGIEPQPQVTLVNISDEIHGPESEIQISRIHILYVQKLKEDSQVVATIKQLSQE